MSGHIYESKPSEIEAIQWTGRNKIQLLSWAPVTFTENPTQCFLEAGVDGAQGKVPVPEHHWIARQVGDASDYWPIADEYFQAKYSKKPWSRDE